MKKLISSITLTATLLASTQAVSSEFFCNNIYEIELEEVTAQSERHHSTLNKMFNLQYGLYTHLIYSIGVGALTTPFGGFIFFGANGVYGSLKYEEISKELRSRIHSASTISAILHEAQNGKEEFVRNVVDRQVEYYKLSLEYEYEGLVDKRAKVGLPAPTFEEFMANNQYASVEQYREERMLASVHGSPIEMFLKEYEGELSYDQIVEYIKAHSVTDKFCPENKPMSFDDFVKTVGAGVSEYSSSSINNELY